MPPHKDHTYIIALLENDVQKIEEIYSNYSPAVQKFVISNNGTDAEAKDVFQDALIDLFHMAEKGFELNCPLKPYFLAMCRYKWFDTIKGKKKRINKESAAIGVTISDDLGLLDIEEKMGTEIVYHLNRENQHKLYREKFLELSQSCQDILGLSLLKNESTGKTNSLKDIAAMLDRNYSYIRREKNNCLNRLIESIQTDDRFKY